MLLTIVGFIMLGLIMVLLFKEKSIPVVAFSVVPPIAAFIAGFSIDQVTEFIKSGMATVSNMGILFIFSITFFGIMSDTGMFDFFVDRLVKRAGNNMLLVGVTTALVACFAHLAGATITTVLITVPALLPVYRRLRLNPHLLLLITACGMGIMNLLPWGGPAARVAAVLNMPVNDLWIHTLPIQILGIFLTIALAVVMTMREMKRRDKMLAEEAEEEKTEELTEEEKKKAEEKEALKRPKLVLFNLILTFGVIGVLIWDVFPNYFVFMIGVAVALIVNYPDVKLQRKRIQAHAASALDVSSVMLAAGVMVGILSESGMLDAMAGPLLQIVPGFIAKYLHIVMGVVSLPIGLTLNTDSFFYGLMPLVIEVGSGHGVAPLSIGITMLVGKNLSLLISPFVPATFLAIGLAKVELSDHLRYCFLPLWIVGLILLAFSVVFGIV